MQCRLICLYSYFYIKNNTHKGKDAVLLIAVAMARKILLIVATIFCLHQPNGSTHYLLGMNYSSSYALLVFINPICTGGLDFFLSTGGPRTYLGKVKYQRALWTVRGSRARFSERGAHPPPTPRYQ